MKKLPYERSELEPYISSKTVDHHYGVHHTNYMKKLNGLLDVSSDYSGDLEKVIIDSHESGNSAIFNNAAQVWNHDFFWQSMKPNGGGEPSGEILVRINDAFGSYEAFKKEFISKAVGHFASGWVWLSIDDGGNLIIHSTSNAMSPIVMGYTPLITCDLWEHAYYLDYQHDRPKFVGDFLSNLVNWDFANRNLPS